MKITGYRPKFDTLISQRESAKILEVTAPTVKRLADDGILPRLGKKFRRSAVLRLKQHPESKEEN